MPLPGARYRVKTTRSGKKVRLAFRGKGKVVEAKNLATGATHTPMEFAQEASRTRQPRRSLGKFLFPFALVGLLVSPASAEVRWAPQMGIPIADADLAAFRSLCWSQEWVVIESTDLIVCAPREAVGFPPPQGGDEEEDKT